MPGRQSHEQLWQITIKLPTDYEPYGQMDRENFGDCSCGCRWYHLLAGRRGEDWGVCANPASQRVGLLTFEHRGCPQFEPDTRSDFLDTANGRKAGQKFEDGEEELQQWRKAVSSSKTTSVHTVLASTTKKRLQTTSKTRRDEAGCGLPDVLLQREC